LSEENLKIKSDTVAEIKDKFGRAKSAVLIDYRGLTVEEVTNLRNTFRQQGVDYKVYKNTLIDRALGEMQIKGLESYLNGPTAVAFGYTDPVAPAKIIDEAIKKLKKTQIKAGFVEGKVFDAGAIQELANLPSREVLVARVLGTLQAPVTGLVSVLGGTLRSVLYALNAVKEHKEKAS
jgi:large subunit ribosomal protein L10